MRREAPVTGFRQWLSRSCAPLPIMEALERRRLLSSTWGEMQASPAVPLTSPAPAAAKAPTQGYTPAQIRQAYGFGPAGQAGFTGSDGSGQTIAIVVAYDDPRIVSDLRVFDRQFGLNDPPMFTRANQSGGTALPARNAGWARETALDVEWAHAVAPEANLVLIEAKSDRLTDLMAAVDTARQLPGVSVVSMSWGVDEFPNESSLDSYFTTPPNHTGVTFVASSGDTSSGEGPQWPSTSPNVLSVGGTSLVLGSSGNVISEATWNGAISGTSRYEPPPAYQTTTQASAQSPATPGRTTPDVGYNGNPLTGFAVYDSLPVGGQAGWTVLGGTSAGAPQWAALVSLANQSRAGDGQGSLDGASTTIPSVYNFYSHAQSASDASGGAATQPAVAADTAAAGNQRNLSAAGGSAQVISALTHNATTVPVTTGQRPGGTGRKHHPPPPTVPPIKAHPAWQPSPGAILAAKASAAGAAFAQPASQIATDAFIPTLTESAGENIAPAPRGAPTLQRAQTLQNGVIGRASFSQIAVESSQLGSTSRSDGDLVATAQELARLAASLIPGNIPADPSSAKNGAANIALPEVFFHIARIDASAAFSDALGSFIFDCATVVLGAADSPKPSPGHARAWAVTTAVVMVDAILVGHVLHHHRQKREARLWAETRITPLFAGQPI